MDDSQFGSNGIIFTVPFNSMYYNNNFVIGEDVEILSDPIQIDGRYEYTIRAISLRAIEFYTHISNSYGR